MTDFPPYITQHDLESIVRTALAEDIGSGDVTTAWTVDPETRASAHFVVRDPGIIAGRTLASLALNEVDPDVTVEWSFDDGDAVVAGDCIGTVSGGARSLLIAERVCLNLIQRMSGIATLTAAFVSEVTSTKAVILDTRKTAPGLRLLDKWAVLLGGGQNHRVGLFDRVLIKENHIRAAGGIASAIARVGQKNTDHLPVEIETRTLDEISQVLSSGGIDRILLDNMVRVENERIDTTELRNAVTLIDGRYETEASGNVTLETVGLIAATGVDYISSGALTHSVNVLDVSLLFEE